MGIIIYLRKLYTILGELSIGSDGDEYEFMIPSNESNFAHIKLSTSRKEIETRYKKEISKESYEFLLSANNEVPHKLQNEFATINVNANKSARELMIYIKYHLDQYNLDEQPIALKDTKWSIDEKDWHSWPIFIKAYASDYGIHPVNISNAQKIQDLLNQRIEPFLALRHLHKARNETLPHYKWIDATTAAELAIKEFLIKSKPEIATLLLEIPSPPLQKLYGTILESLGFEKSPRLKEISKGVETRNKLVHRPEEIVIDPGEANKYVRDVEIAIHHLILMLYPNNKHIEYYYRDWVDQ